MKKILRASKRGITFSLGENDIQIGAHYRYIIDKLGRKVCIIPDADGPLKVSRKKSGDQLKPLFDLRSREVRDLIQNSAYMEVCIEHEQIIVYVYKKAEVKASGTKIVSLEEILGIRAGKIIIPEPQTIAEAVGDEYFYYLLKNYIPSGRGGHKRQDKTIRELKKVYDVVSLFSGAGLFDKAWLDDGCFRFVYANDFCKDVIETYRYNIGNHIVCKDIRDIKPDELPFSDVFVTSPCCQAFSNANRHNLDSKEGEGKRRLVDEVVRLALAKKPKVVVIENVPQMLTKEDGLYLDKVISGLPGYAVSAQIVTDYKVGGYSARQRCIILASRIGKILLPELDLKPYKTVKDALERVDESWPNVNDVTVPSVKTAEKMSYVPQGGNWKDIPPKLNTYGPNTQSNIFRRLKLDEVSPTITNFRKSNILHPTENRTLSVSEAAAIMGFGKDFKFLGGLSAKQQMVANGVTYAIAKLVKDSVKKALDRVIIPIETAKAVSM